MDSKTEKGREIFRSQYVKPKKAFIFLTFVALIPTFVGIFMTFVSPLSDPSLNFIFYLNFIIILTILVSTWFLLIIIMYLLTYLVIYENGIKIRKSTYLLCLRRKYIPFDHITDVSIKKDKWHPDMNVLVVYINDHKPFKIQEEFISNIDRAKDLISINISPEKSKMEKKEEENIKDAKYWLKFWVVGKIGILASYGILFGITFLFLKKDLITGVILLICGIIALILGIWVALLKEKPSPIEFKNHRFNITMIILFGIAIFVGMFFTLLQVTIFFAIFGSLSLSVFFTLASLWLYHEDVKRQNDDGLIKKYTSLLLKILSYLEKISNDKRYAFTRELAEKFSKPKTTILNKTNILAKDGLIFKKEVKDPKTNLNTFSHSITKKGVQLLNDISKEMLPEDKNNNSDKL